MCFGKLLPPFCKVFVAPACCRERKREGKGWREPKKTSLLGGRVSNLLTLRLSTGRSGWVVFPTAWRVQTGPRFPSALLLSRGMTDEPLKPSRSPPPCAFSLRTQDKTHRYTKHDVTRQSRCVIKV